jgi:hypothetical protein
MGTKERRKRAVDDVVVISTIRQTSAVWPDP